MVLITTEARFTADTEPTETERFIEYVGRLAEAIWFAWSN